MKTKLFCLVILAFSFCMISCEKEPAPNDISHENVTIEMRDGEQEGPISEPGNQVITYYVQAEGITDRSYELESVEDVDNFIDDLRLPDETFF